MSFRGDAGHRIRNLEIPRCATAHLRFARSLSSGAHSRDPLARPGMTIIINAIVSGGIPLFAVFSDAYLDGMSRSNACAAARFGRTVDVKFRSRFFEEIELP